MEAPSENRFALPKVIQLVREELGVEPKPPELAHQEKRDPTEHLLALSTQTYSLPIRS